MLNAGVQKICILCTELCKTTFVKCLTNALHQCVVEVQVVHDGQTHTEHFICLEQMTDVCAGMTALTQTLVRSMQGLTRDEVEYEVSPGRVDIYYGNLSEEGKLLVDSFFIGACLIADEFPEYVRVE